MRLKIRHGGAITWRCDACGAINDDTEQFCNECKAERIVGLTVPPKPKPEAKKKETDEATAEPSPLEASLPELTPPEPSLPEALIPEPSPLPPDDDEAEESKDDEPVPLPEFEIPPQLEPPKQVETPTRLETPTPVETPAYPPSLTGHERYYFVFVNTPAQSLIKSRFPIEFDLFPVISIGRSPENIVVIPDQEVSRKHAELTTDGTKLFLKDLNSKNGTYLYNGKEFQQVSDSVEVKPSSILKFGTNTIVRLTSE